MQRIVHFLLKCKNEWKMLKKNPISYNPKDYTYKSHWNPIIVIPISLTYVLL